MKDIKFLILQIILMIIPIVLSILFSSGVINYFNKNPDKKSENRSVLNLAYTNIIILIIAFVLIILAIILKKQNNNNNEKIIIIMTGLSIFLYLIHIICLFTMYIILYTRNIINGKYEYKYETINKYISNKYNIKADKSTHIIRALYSTNIILSIFSLFIYMHITWNIKSIKNN